MRRAPFTTTYKTAPFRGCLVSGGERGISLPLRGALVSARCACLGSNRLFDYRGFEDLRTTTYKTAPFRGYFVSGGERGIRTLDTLLTYTPLAGERFRPLSHLSVIRNRRPAVFRNDWTGEYSRAARGVKALLRISAWLASRRHRCWQSVLVGSAGRFPRGAPRLL